MYEVIVFMPGHEEHESFIADFPPTWSQEQVILADYPDGAWLDVSRLPEEDCMSDTIGFRDEVHWELEPFSIEPFIDEQLI